MAQFSKLMQSYSFDLRSFALFNPPSLLLFLQRYLLSLGIELELTVKYLQSGRLYRQTAWLLSHP